MNLRQKLQENRTSEEVATEIGYTKRKLEELEQELVQIAKGNSYMTYYRVYFDWSNTSIKSETCNFMINPRGTKDRWNDLVDSMGSTDCSLNWFPTLQEAYNKEFAELMQSMDTYVKQMEAFKNFAENEGLDQIIIPQSR
jgi:hypothetical protein